MNYELNISAPALGFWEWLRIFLCSWTQSERAVLRNRILRVFVTCGQTVHIGRRCDVRKGGQSARHKHPANVFCHMQKEGENITRLCCLDPYISKYHATFRVDNNGVLTAQDRGSKSGVWINGARLLVPYAVCAFTANDRFVCGQTRITVTLVDEKLSTCCI